MAYVIQYKRTYENNLGWRDSYTPCRFLTEDSAIDAVYERMGHNDGSFEYRVLSVLEARVVFEAPSYP